VINFNCERRMRRNTTQPSSARQRNAAPSAPDQTVFEELKSVTLLTIDIRGFSRIARRLGPRRSVLLLNRFFAATGEIVFRYQGMVDKYLGDGFLAIFGSAASAAEDAENALHAALEMRDCLRELNPCLLADFGTSIHIGMSLHTGEVALGSIGCEKKMDCTVIGDTVNTVFRMQGHVKTCPNGILVSGPTLSATRCRFRVQAAYVSQQARRDLGELAVYELLGRAPEGDERMTAGYAIQTRVASPSKTQLTPRPTLPPPVLSP
jgi:class 3 adenylate cyclase